MDQTGFHVISLEVNRQILVIAEKKYPLAVRYAALF
jgi:hypothetical protein